jgi:hypothetical protein
MVCYSVREEIQRPAREDAEPETTGVRWVASKVGNGYFLLQPSLPPSEVMVVRGASVFAHRRVPLDYAFFCLAFLPVLRSIPLPQYRAALYSLSLVISLSVQNRHRMPEIT